MGAHRFAGVCAAAVCFSVDRHRRRSQRHVDPCAARSRSRAGAPRRGGDRGLDHDDRRIRRHDSERRPLSRSLFAGAPSLPRHCVVAVLAVLVSTAAVWRIEKPAARPHQRPALSDTRRHRTAFGKRWRRSWRSPQTRAFALFVFVAMLAYSAEELILDPFSGAVFGFSPGASTKLSGVLHSGVLVGMIVVGTRWTPLRRDKARLVALMGDRRLSGLGACALEPRLRRALRHARGRSRVPFCFSAPPMGRSRSPRSAR